jgi:hypothetical protein
MTRRARHLKVIVLCGCLLTLVASADDFNLARVAVPAAFAGAPARTLPLDDENTDFLASSAAPGSGQSRGRNPRNRPEPRRHAARTATGAFLASGPTAPRRNLLLAHDSFHPPLRC